MFDEMLKFLGKISFAIFFLPVVVSAEFSSSFGRSINNEWIWYTKTKGYDLYYKKGEWSESRRFRSYQVKLSGEGDLNGVIEQLADCENWRYRPAYKTEDKKWRYVRPNTPQDKILTGVCAK